MPEQADMTQGTCPKCGSQEVYVSPPGSAARSGGAYGGNSITLAMFSAAPLVNFICLDCHYVERYATLKPAQKALIQRKWLRVADQPKRKRKNDDWT